MSVDGILGKKIGMTQVFRDDGSRVSVTAIKAGPCTVTQIRFPARDGYNAVQLGYGNVRKLNKPKSGHLKKTSALVRHLREVSSEEMGDVEVGQVVKVDIFNEGELVNVVGTSKGHGFTGVVKRHGFKGGPKTHGQSDRHRAPGSIGSTTYPGRVLKGTKMAGRWGNDRVTVKNLEIISVDLERDILLVKGAVPGSSNALLIVQRSSVKRK